MVLVGNCYDEQIRLLRCKYFVIILFGRSKQIFGTHIIAPTLECRHCPKFGVFYMYVCPAVNCTTHTIQIMGSIVIREE